MKLKDYLKRDDYVKLIINLIKNYSQSNVNISFAIDGIWGCGKSFVLDMIEEQLKAFQSEETATDAYAVFRYNCWQYDYYDEPLIAIVSMMINQIDSNENLLSADQKEKVKGIFKAIGTVILSCSNEAIKDKTGFDIKNIINDVKNVQNDTANNINEKFDFDPFWEFNEAFNLLKETIRDISKDKTIIFIVDELDRCLPEYAIKVLERLHHISEDVDNIITIISVDKSKLLKSISSTFGYLNDDNNRESEIYLKKFIDFYVPLNKGTIDKDINEKYTKYIDLFNKDIFDCKISFCEYITLLFNGIDIREQEHIIEKCLLIHNSITTKNFDYTVMFMELLATTFFCYYGITADKIKDIINGRKLNKTSELTAFCEEFKSLEYSSSYSYWNEKRYNIVNDKNGIWQILEWYYTFLSTNKETSVVGNLSRNSEQIKIDLENNLLYLQEYNNCLQLF